MRIIIFTGKGGAGTSTLASATAAAIAAGGRRTLAFGLGAGLASAFDLPLGGRPQPVAADLWAMESVPGRHDAPGPVLAWLRDLFAWRDMDETVADDVAALPGMVDLARLLTIEEHLKSGDFDSVVVDCPAVRHTLDILAALDAAARAMDRMFPSREPTVLDPFLRALSGYSTDGEEIYEGGRELLLRLSRLRQALADPDSASVRLVLTAEKGSLVEIKRAVTALSLFAYPLDAAFCNRLLPEEAGPWAKSRRDDEQAALGNASESLAPLPVHPVTLRPRDIAGVEDLAGLAHVAYGKAEPGAILFRGPVQAISHRDDAYLLSLPLPFAERDELAIERLDDALIVHVGERSRTFDLPDEAQRLDAVSSAFDGDTLRVTFSRQS